MRMLKPRVAAADLATARVPEKRADAELLTAAHRAWRELVLRRAGYCCEATDDGERCRRGPPTHKLYAHHVVERADGGALLDPANGRCLCAHHHTLATNAARGRRYQLRP